MCIFSAVTFIQAYFNQDRESGKLWENIQIHKLIIVVLGLFIYTFFLDVVGFLICTFLLILFLIRFVGYENWRKSIAGAILTSTLCYLLFDKWLQANLPRGILGF